MVEVYGYLHPNENKTNDVQTIPFDILSKNKIRLDSSSMAGISQLKPRKIQENIDKYKDIEHFLRAYFRRYNGTVTSHDVKKDYCVDKGDFEYQLMELSYRLLGLMKTEDGFTDPFPTLFLFRSYQGLEEELLKNISDELGKSGYERLFIPKRNLTLIKGMCSKNQTKNYVHLFNREFELFKDKIMPLLD